MIHILRQCPLCHQDLILSPPATKMFPPPPMWECTTQINDQAWGTKHSHYMVDIDELIRVFVGNYQLLDFTYNTNTYYAGNHRQFEIYKVTHVEGDGINKPPSGIEYAYIISVPKFKIESEQHLLHKIKTIITFS